jgi:hypothetical protein
MQASPLQEFGGMKIAYFKLKPGASEQALLRVAALIERDFFAELPGLVHHSLIKGADGLYADLTFATAKPGPKRFVRSGRRTLTQATTWRYWPRTRPS